MIPRWLESEVRDALAYRRGVHLTGARQCGRTTLTAMLALESSRRVTLDDEGVRLAAGRDPVSFVERRGERTLVIDEVQKEVRLLEAIKTRVDEDASKGQYLLTGSANLRFARKMRDSLAGRLETIRLRTLTLAETNGSPASFLERAFKGSFDVGPTSLSKRDVVHSAFVGGYPEPMTFPERRRRRWFREYLTDLLTRDIQDVTEIRKVDVLEQVAVWLLAHSAQYFSVEELSASVGVMKPTVENYLAALKALYLFDRIPAWAKSDYERIGKRPKWVVADTGLLTNILNWNENDLLDDDRRNVKLVESWVYHELASQADVLGGCEISQYRDKDKREIDFLVENDGGQMLGVEVKAGASVCDGDFRHMRWFAQNLAKKQMIGIVLYSGRELLSFGKGFWAVPMAALA